MNLIKRNNVTLIGAGDEVLVLSHGYCCSQEMWRLVAPELEKS
jgi:sigma-B regulation protein RsbQ